MAISRQSDSIWVLGYGHDYSPARDEDHYGLKRSTHDYGEALGRHHADESIDHYHRDAKGRFAPMPHHEKELEEATRKSKWEHRDDLHEGYYKGFHGRIKEHETAEKEKANKTSMFREAVKVDPFAGHVKGVTFDDPGRFQHMLTHGGSDKGYVAPTWLQRTLGTDGPVDDDEKWETGHPTAKNPHKPDLDALINVANGKKFGLNLGMSTKRPFSRNDVGTAQGNPKLKDNRERPNMRPGEIASEPITVEDHLGNVHTFVHHITAPNLNPISEENPEHGGMWAVNLHHHVNRPDGTADWLPSETTWHSGGENDPNGEKSNELYRDIWGRLHANSDMVSFYGAGGQRVNKLGGGYEYEFPHKSGQVKYKVKLANRWNKYDGYQYTPGLDSKHPEALPGGPQWIITGHGKVREHPFDPNSERSMALLEGSDHPSDQTISFPKDDIHKVIDYVHAGLGGKDQRPYAHLEDPLPNTGGLPPEHMIQQRSSSVRPWRPEYNIHRSAERPGLSF